MKLEKYGEVILRNVTFGKKNNILYHFSGDTTKIALFNYSWLYICAPMKVIQYKRLIMWSAETFLWYHWIHSSQKPRSYHQHHHCQSMHPSMFLIVVKTINICLDEVKLTYNIILAWDLQHNNLIKNDHHSKFCKRLIYSYFFVFLQWEL